MSGKSKYAIILAVLFVFFTSLFVFTPILLNANERVPLFFNGEASGYAVCVKEEATKDGSIKRNVFAFDKTASSFLAKNSSFAEALVFHLEGGAQPIGHFEAAIGTATPISMELKEKSAVVSSTFASSSEVRGFKASKGVKIMKISLEKPRGGFDFTVSPHFYGFIDGELLDFSLAKDYFPARHTKERLEAEFSFKLKNGGNEKVSLDFGGEAFLLRSPNEEYEGVFQCSLLKNPYSVVRIKSGEDCVEKLILRENTADVAKMSPLVSDLELILSGRRNHWRNEGFEFYRWDRFRNVFFLDFHDYKEQSDFFLRLSFFSEKRGFRTRLLSDEELSGKHSYNAHDYNLSTLAAFFTEAARQNFPLNEKEILLRKILEENGILKEENGKFSAVPGALISISMQSQRWLRRSLLNHEGWHALHFVDEGLKRKVDEVYKKADKLSLEFLKLYWVSYPSLQYDINYEPLMQTEFLAYLMQQPLKDCRRYFLHLIERTPSALLTEDMRDELKRSEAEGLYSAAEEIDAYVKARWNLCAGRVSLTTRE